MIALVRALGAVALAIAAGIHIAVVPQHFREAVPHGGFFVLLAAAQGLWAVQVMRGAGLRTLRLIALANTAVIAVWALSRTMGLPGASVEQVGIADLSSTVVEGIAVACALALSGARSSLRRTAWVPVAAMVGVSTFGGATLAAASPVQEHHHATGRMHREHGGVEGAAAGTHLHGISDGRTDPGPQHGVRGDAPSIDVGAMPTAIVAGFGKLWVTDRQLGTLTVIDPEADSTRSIPVGKGLSGVATGQGAVWVTDFSTDQLVRVDPETLTTRRAPIGSGPTAVAVDREGIWVTSITRGIVQLVDAGTLEVRATIPVGFGPAGITTGEDAVWVVNTLDRTVVRIDARTRRLVGDPIEVGAGAVGITTAFGRVWVASASAGTVDVIEPASGLTRQLRVDDISLPGQGPIAVTAARGRVWVANNHDKTVRSIDPDTYATGPVMFFSKSLGTYPIAVQIAHQGDSLWVTNYQDGTVRRVRVPE